MKHKRLLKILLLVLLILFASTLFFAVNVAAPKLNQHKSNTTPVTTKKATGFNKSRYSVTDPASIWVIVNKQHALKPIDYAPTDLVTPDVELRVPGHDSMRVRQAVARALEEMLAAGNNNGLHIVLSSGYRSYDYQVGLYNGYVNKNGQAAADTFSARPGHSEHQTGLAVDLEPYSRTCELEQCFGDTPEGKWLAANAYMYGFILRYTAANQSMTGYEGEPWHFRYVGKELAVEMHKTGITSLEEFFKVSGGPSYN